MIYNIAERKRSLEKLGFQGSQISRGIFAEAKLQATSLLTFLQLGTQFMPTLIITRPQVLSREKVLLGGNSGNEADRTANHYSRDGSSPPGRTPLVDAGHAKTVLQVIVGARQSLHVIAVKEPSSKVAGDVRKVVNGFLLVRTFIVIFFNILTDFSWLNFHV